ncbi:methyltransferase domain-containing protein [Pseudomonas idahonensis]|uniref:methyltransferase domain-containing protein n=1 Tax=Pseudomonas idahonensis TaxID=2942628 RepID=UPI003BB1DFF6
MTMPFYRAFEDRHRGSRDLILGRLDVYLPFIAPLQQIYDERFALDLGCGRGEWLQALLQNGFSPMGVDLDEGMLEGCKALNLPAIQGDALEFLKNLPDESQVIISGFHIAEHIPFNDLKELVAQALRVLKPAGLLILETPNAENIVVGTQSFYLDPTHERPIPHLLLSFLTEYSGFFRSKLLRLQESSEVVTAPSMTLMSVLGGASPDYAIVAQKQALPDILEHFDAVFQKEYGLSLEVLAHRYDAEAQWRNSQHENCANELNESLGVVVHKVEEIQQKNNLLESTVHALCERTDNSESRLTRLEICSDQVNQRIKDVADYASEAGARLSAVQAISEVFQAQLNTASDRVILLETQVNNLKGSLAEQTSHVSRLETELIELEAEYQKVALEQPAQNAELARLMQLLEEAEERKDLLEGDLLTSSDDLSKAEERIKSLESMSYEADEDIKLLQEQLAERDLCLTTLRDGEMLLLALLEGKSCQLNAQAMPSGLHRVYKKLEELQSIIVENQNSQVLLEVERDAAISHSQDLTAQVDVLKARLSDTLGAAHHWQIHAKNHEARVSSILNSTSWRLTLPLRGLRLGAGVILKTPFTLTKTVLRSVLKPVINIILARPELRRRLNVRIKQYPRLHAHLKRFSVHQGILPQDSAFFSVASNVAPSSPDFSDLSILLESDLSHSSSGSDDVQSLVQHVHTVVTTESERVVTQMQSQHFHLPKDKAHTDMKGPLESWFFK